MPARAGGGSVRRGLVWAVVVTLIITATLLMATARPAMAHATLLSTTPMGDELLPRGPDAIEPQFYTVAWRVLSGDSRKLEGNPDDDGIGAGGLLAGGFLALVVGGCAVGFARSARRARADR